MLDPLGRLLTEVRDDADVSALVSTRVRGFEPAPGDAKPAGSYQAFVVISALSAARETRSPTARWTYGVRCYGSTPQNAMAVYAACSDAIHHIGPRLRASDGLGIYISHDIGGGSAEKDPDTQQPVVIFTVELFATTVAVA